MITRVQAIDAHTWVPGYSSVYLIVSSKIALIETGLSSSAEALLEGIRSCGVRPEEVSHILLTHLHLDHAGSAGLLARQLPEADIMVHPMGIPRLVDPSRLLNSARKALGPFSDAYHLDQIVPLEPERLKPLVEGSVVNLGDTKLTVIETPGHAPHHLCFHEETTNGIFVGDAAGIYFPATDAVSFATPSPNFDLALTFKDIERIGAMRPEVLYFSHYGPNRNADKTLSLATQKLHQWEEIVRKAAEEGRNPASVAQMIADDIANDAPMTPRWLHEELAKLYADGFIKYIDQTA